MCTHWSSALIGICSVSIGLSFLFLEEGKHDQSLPVFNDENVPCLYTPNVIEMNLKIGLQQK